MQLIKHSIYNLLGLGLPLVVAIFSIPVLLHGLGDSKFGLLTLIWALVSYFGLFDLGLARALTQHLASILDGPNHLDSGRIAITSLVMITLLGILACIGIFIFGPIGIGYLKLLADPQEAIRATYIMALAMPFILLTSGFRGILEAKHKFGIINAMRLPMGLFTFIGPMVVVLYFGPNLELITLVLVIGRVFACVVHGWYAWIALRSNHGKLEFDGKLLKPLCLSGGWMTVSNLVSPLMGYLDRFVIGFTISAAAVAFYTTPQEMVTKLSIIPGALTAVLFPAFASRLAGGRDQTRAIFKFSIELIFLILLPISLSLIFFSDKLLTLWINYDFSLNSQIYLKIFALGILINCITHIPFTLIQSAGLAKTTAKIHIIQFPIYFILLWILIHFYGVLGAALAWLTRMVFDSILMFSACYKIMNWRCGRITNMVNISHFILLIMVVSIGFYENLLLKLIVIALVYIYSFNKILKTYIKYNI